MEELKERFPRRPRLRASRSTRRSRSPRASTRSSRRSFEALVAGDPRGVHLPAGLAGHADPAARGAGLAGRHVRGLSRCSASRSTRSRSSASCWRSASWWTTPSWWSRRSSTTSSRAVAARRHAQGDGGGVGPGRGDRADPGRRLRADRVHPGHHRAALPAVRGDHRRLGADLGLQRAHAEPGARRRCCCGPKRETRGPLGAFFRGFNRVVRPGHRRLRGHWRAS